LRTIVLWNTILRSPTTPHGPEGATIADGSHRAIVLDGAVSEAIDVVGDYLSELCCDVVYSPAPTSLIRGLGCQFGCQCLMPHGGGAAKGALHRNH